MVPGLPPGIHTFCLTALPAGSHGNGAMWNNQCRDALFLFVIRSPVFGSRPRGRICSRVIPHLIPQHNTQHGNGKTYCSALESETSGASETSEASLYVALAHTLPISAGAVAGRQAFADSAT